MMTHLRLLGSSLVLVAACSSSSSPDTGAPQDASLDVNHPDATPDASPDAAACLATDAAIPECLQGAPCACDDVASDDAPAICVGSAWQCPDGYTKFEDCGGVPPGPGCHGDGGIDDAGDGGG
jgi:hypothetical protein